MKKIIFILIVFASLSSCSVQDYILGSDYFEKTFPENTVFLCSHIETIKVYDSHSKKRKLIYSISPNKSFIASKYNNEYAKIEYNNQIGYAKKLIVYKQLEIMPDVVEYIEYDDLIGHYLPDSIINEYSNSNPDYNSNSSYSGYSTSSGGAVHVKGYFKKNGTYVKSHTRSAPKSKSSSSYKRSSGRRK